MCMPWSIGIIIFVAGISFDYQQVHQVMRIFNILWPIFIFIIFVCKPSVWKMFKLKFPRMSPFFSTCEELGSKIICMKSKHQPLVTVTRNQLNSINMAGISGKFTQIGYQRHTESTVWNKHASNYLHLWYTQKIPEKRWIYNTIIYENAVVKSGYWFENNKFNAITNGKVLSLIIL
jgi:hypothetical protein